VRCGGPATWRSRRADGGGYFFKRAIAKRYGKFARVVCGISRYPRGVLHHHAGRLRGKLAKENAANVADIDPQRLAARASDKAHRATDAQKLAPGRYTVILEPAAVLDLVGFLFYDFAATALRDKRSCFNERMGKQLFGKNISIVDDVYHPLQLGAPYDGEGIARERVQLVDGGVPKTWCIRELPRS